MEVPVHSGPAATTDADANRGAGAERHAHPPARRSLLAPLAERARRARPWQVFLVALVLFFGMQGTWALITPLGGSPDEPAHMIKAAGVARGQGNGADVDGTQLREFMVPAGIVQLTRGIDCTVFQDTVPADCGLDTPVDSAEPVPAISSAGLYNPVYYTLVGWPTLLDNNEAGLYGARLVSALLNSLFFALAITCLARLPRARLPLLVGLTMVTPTAAFLGGMVNPNMLEVATVTAFTAALVAALQRESRGAELWWLTAIMAVSGALAVHARSLAPMWIFVAVLVVACVAGWGAFWRFLRQPAAIVAVVAVAASTAGALVITLRTGTLDQMGNYPGQGTPWHVGLRTMLWNFWDYVPPMVGTFGWNDTIIPQIATYSIISLLLALIALAVLGRTGVWPRLGVLFAAACFIGIPAVVQAASVTRSGYIWQGRYALAMWMVLALAAAVAAAPVFARLERTSARRLIAFVLILVAFVHAAGMHEMLYRYGVGLGPTLNDFWFRSQWSPFGLPMFAVVVAVSLGATAWLVLARTLVEMAGGSRSAAHLASGGSVRE